MSQKIFKFPIFFRKEIERKTALTFMSFNRYSMVSTPTMLNRGLGSVCQGQMYEPKVSKDLVDGISIETIVQVL
jgi:hypothetical protein